MESELTVRLKVTKNEREQMKQFSCFVEEIATALEKSGMEEAKDDAYRIYQAKNKILEIYLRYVEAKDEK